MKKFLVTLILLLITLPAWAGNTILIIGDSLSAGYGIDPQQGWVALLQQRISNHHFNYSVVNDSISGDTTSNGLNRLPAALKLYHPTITIIELGGNDALRGLQLFVIKNNLQQMVAQVQAAGSQVLMLGVRIPPNYGPAYTQQFQQMYVDIAQANQISLVPLFLNGIDTHTELMQDDHIHPTTVAQSILLNNVWPSLEKLLK